MNHGEVLQAVIRERSYYPECERKSEEERKADLLRWYGKYNEINEFYNVWGFDRAGYNKEDIWLDHGLFRKQRYEINSQFFFSKDPFPTNYTVIMRDKSIFEMYISSLLNEPSKYVHSYAFFKGFQFISNEGGYLQRRNDSIDKFCVRHDGEKIILKRASGCSGLGVYVCKVQGGKICHTEDTERPIEPDSFLQRDVTWMIQPFVKQHPFMAKLNAGTVNIVRIVTFNTGKRVFSVPPMLVYSRGDTEVCNSDQGSFYVGIGRDGTIEKKAVDRLGQCFADCPAGGLKLPYFEEIKDLVCYIHSGIPELFTVGWDVAITDNGPLVFEGNDGWCPYVSQWNDDTALRPTWDKAVAERREYFAR